MVKRTSTRVALVFALIGLLGLAMLVIGPLLGPDSYIGRDLVIFGPVVAMLGGLGLFASLLVGFLRSPKPQQAPAPGWHPDPHDPALLRYFDGRQWTENTAPRQ